MKKSSLSHLALTTATLGVLFLHGTALGHSGGTNADGCHTNSKTGDYHCHNSGTSGGGGSGGGSTYTPTPSYTSCEKPNEMVNGRCTDPVNACIAKYGHHSEYTNAGCGCEDSYQLNASKTGCDFANAASSSSRDDKARALRQIEQSKNAKIQKSSSSVASSVTSSNSVAGFETQQAKVMAAIDGDTLRVKVGKKTEKVRIIGIDTPETVDPRKPIQCFGKEASARLKKLLNRKAIVLEKNPAEDRDKYKRLLRYVSLNGEDVGAQMIHEGYAFSYKQYPHPRLEEYNALETEAREAKRGLWGSKCDYSGVTAGNASSKSSVRSSKSSTSSVTTSTSGTCDIKGNISSKKEKIFHVPGCASYNATVIDESAEETMFCSEEEALAAGWRKALNCP